MANVVLEFNGPWAPRGLKNREGHEFYSCQIEALPEIAASAAEVHGSSLNPGKAEQ